VLGATSSSSAACLTVTNPSRWSMGPILELR